MDKALRTLERSPVAESALSTVFSGEILAELRKNGYITFSNQPGRRLAGLSSKGKRFVNQQREAQRYKKESYNDREKRNEEVLSILQEKSKHFTEYEATVPDTPMKEVWDGADEAGTASWLAVQHIRNEIWHQIKKDYPTEDLLNSLHYLKKEGKVRSFRKGKRTFWFLVVQ